MIGKLLYIADDHPVITESLSVFFESHFEKILTFSNGEDLKENLLSRLPSHLIVDINMPLVSGLEILELLKSESFLVETVVFSMYNSNSLIKKCKSFGAGGYVLKTAPNNEVYDAFLSDGFYLGGGLKMEKDVDFNSELTPREEEVLKLLVKDFNSKQIAEALFVSEFTVATHRRNIKRKLDVDTTSGLIKFAFENGLVGI